ncbi:MAG TPA: hypothetical protein PLI09_03845 [Candidatus Hydrogenedentes bacterium]|nr:hypothetical protein [Candidatus Hydrogenedentota bacterium]
MNTVFALCLVVCGGLEEWQGRMVAAQKSYDISEAQKVTDEIRAALGSQANPELRLMFARSLLLTAELCRTDYEVLSEEGADREKRRALGEKIDALAKEGMDAAEALGDVSEHYRIKSDFYGLMIRSKYQGKKYRNKLESSSAKALELDPKNPYAYVSVSRPYLFAGPHQGGDVKRAMELLNKAIELKPDYEAALQLRAVGYEKLGEKAKSDEEWNKILAVHPDASRSRKTLEIAGKVWTEEDAAGS